MHPVILVAGPLLLERGPEGKEVIGGDGFLAAAAAAPYATPQLWARGGAAFTPQLKTVLTARHLDLAGTDFDGPAPKAPPYLPQIEPVSARDLAGAMVLGLDGPETERAVGVIASLPEERRRTVLVSPTAAAVAADPALPGRLARRADLLHLPLPAGLTWAGTEDPAVALARLRELGFAVILLSAGPLGGLAAYKDRRTTWPAQAREAVPGSPAPGPIHLGVLAGFLADHGGLDWQGLKRGLATAAAVVAAALPGPGPKRLLRLDKTGYRDLYHKLRRNSKF